MGNSRTAGQPWYLCGRAPSKQKPSSQTFWRRNIRARRMRRWLRPLRMASPWNLPGKILLTLKLASEYGFADVDGSLPMDYTQLNNLLAMNGNTWLAALVPNLIKIPFLAVHMGSYKF